MKHSKGNCWIWIWWVKTAVGNASMEAALSIAGFPAQLSSQISFIVWQMRLNYFIMLRAMQKLINQLKVATTTKDNPITNCTNKPTTTRCSVSHPEIASGNSNVGWIHHFGTNPSFAPEKYLLLRFELLKIMNWNSLLADANGKCGTVMGEKRCAMQTVFRLHSEFFEGN